MDIIKNFPKIKDEVKDLFKDLKGIGASGEKRLDDLASRVETMLEWKKNAKSEEEKAQAESKIAEMNEQHLNKMKEIYATHNAKMQEITANKRDTANGAEG